MDVKSFGTADGAEIKEIMLRSASGATASVITRGAVLRDLVVPSSNGPQRVVLGLNSLEDYIKYSPHFGATPGRFANRIAGGRFTLDGKAYQLPLNEKGKTTLHGGPQGFGKRAWTLESAAADRVTLVLDSPDGDAGFPGAVRAVCTYTLLDPGTLRVDLSATTDAPTIVNLAHHSYFNLDGSADILDHEVMIASEFRTPVDDDNIPTGEIVTVAGTPFDFRRMRPVRDPSETRYDHNFIIAPLPEAPGALVHAASARSPKNGLRLEVHTDQPAVQFYDAAKLNCPVAGLGGAHYGPHGGLCFEAQTYPDAPNRRHFPSATLRPGDTYRQRTEYRFIA
ncbi:MAG TPA: aldose epimerase family protein [Lichenihabitans sp.]|jgi:aldose 1-epimerase|nr:aldose epimerase family protein [Lichenihabitans sp.]